MAYSAEVMQRAYKLDPDAWQSYSGKPKDYKQIMDARRTKAINASLETQAVIDRANRVSQRADFIREIEGAKSIDDIKIIILSLSSFIKFEGE